MKKIYILILLSVGLIQINLAQCPFTGLLPNYCVNSPTSALSSTVPGGTFSGPGVLGSVFSPSLAGPGTHTITYSFCSPTYTQTSAGYSPIATPTANAENAVFLSDDQTSSAFNIGFNFRFFCNVYTQFYISSNGYIMFNNGPNGCCSGQSLPNATTPNDVIALCWEDFNPGAGGTISYVTIGTAPNRVLIVKFTGVPHFGGGGGALTGQLQLFETTNVIEAHIASMVTDGGAHTQGIENSNGTAAYTPVGRNAASWSASNDMVRWTPMAACSSTQVTTVSPSTITVVGNNSICIGASSTLSASGNNTYTWSTGSNASSIVDNPSVTTTYTVGGTNSFGCIAQSAITVTVDNTPTVTAVSSTGNSGVCPGATIALTGSGATSYTWTGGVSNGISFTTSTTNTYVVTGANACGTSTAAVSVSIHPIPPVTASATQPSVCTGNTVALLGGGALTYTWSNAIPNGQAFFPATTANYTVTGTSALGCTASAVTGVTAVTTPVLAPLATPSLICIGSSGTISAQGATNYTWLPGNLSTGTIVVSPTITTTYTLIKSNSNCVDTKTITLFVNQLPNVFAIVQPTVVCVGSTATLSGGGAFSYTWTPSGFNLIGANVVVSPTANTIYTCTGNDGTCTATYTVLLSTNPVPTIQAQASSSAICAGQSVTLTANGALNYTWSPGTFTGSVVVDVPAGPTSYNVVGTNSYNCSSQNNVAVIVYPNPTLSAIPNRTLVCVNGPSTITATGANTYSWNTGSLTNTVVVYPGTTTIYTVTGTYTNSGCSSTKTVMVSTYFPVTGITGPTAVCIGSSITIGSAPANSYTWTLNGNLISNQPNILINPVVNTTYSLSTTSTSNNVNCVGGNSVTIQVNPLPVITASTTRSVICRTFEFTTLTAAGGVSYNWIFLGSGTSVTVSPNAQTTYTVEGTDANGCVNTATILIKVSACLGLEENPGQERAFSVYPNPSNGSFTIRSAESMRLSLTNVTGQLIQEMELNAENNYTLKVTDLARGLYFIKKVSTRGTSGYKLIVD
ncbi:MAG TPA: T9SS type A sorting domain-containing protein [Bacteroidia bacterium]|nr:T9SS type A sorting domain-containing protein [Bacteroidia bacterium]